VKVAIKTTYFEVAVFWVVMWCDTNLLEGLAESIFRVKCCLPTEDSDARLETSTTYPLQLILTPWSKVLEKRTVTQLVKNFPQFTEGYHSSVYIIISLLRLINGSMWKKWSKSAVHSCINGATNTPVTLYYSCYISPSPSDHKVS